MRIASSLAAALLAALSAAAAHASRLLFIGNSFTDAQGSAVHSTSA